MKILCFIKMLKAVYVHIPLHSCYSRYQIWFLLMLERYRNIYLIIFPCLRTEARGMVVLGEQASWQVLADASVAATRPHWIPTHYRNVSKTDVKYGAQALSPEKKYLALSEVISLYFIWPYHREKICILFDLLIGRRFVFYLTFSSGEKFILMPWNILSTKYNLLNLFWGRYFI